MPRSSGDRERATPGKNRCRSKLEKSYHCIRGARGRGLGKTSCMDLQTKRTVVINSVSAELIGPGQLRLSGSLTNDADRDSLATHLRGLHDHVVATQVPSLTVDVRGLSFVNSSAIRLFVDLGSRAQASGYGLVFDIDSSVTWHRLSFSVLKTLAPATITIRDHAAAAGKGPGNS
jgi:hypothetical protein